MATEKETLNKPRGGSRPNSGRKPSADPRRSCTVSLNRAELAAFRALGGSKWLQGLLSAYL